MSRFLEKAYPPKRAAPALFVNRAHDRNINAEPRVRGLTLLQLNRPRLAMSVSGQRGNARGQRPMQE
jgi:hypothetical protein